MIVAGMQLPDEAKHFADQLSGYHLRYGRGLYKPTKFLAVLNTCVGRRGHAVDVGAHVGLWSYPLSFEFRKITAFEPVEEFAECWRANMADRHNAEFRPIALGVAEGRAGFVRVPDGEGTIQWVGAGSWSVVKRLDDQNLDPIDLLKVSCDGCELPVIQGGEQTIRCDKPVVLVQQKRKRSDVYGYPRNGALDLLKSWGAQLVWDSKGDYCFRFPA